MKDFFSSLKFKVLIVLLVLLAGIMAYAAANGRLSAAPGELMGAVAVPFQKVAAAISGASEDFINKYIRIDSIIAENEQLTKENADLREKMVDYDMMKRENEQYKEAWQIKEENPSYQVVNANVIGRDALEKYYSFTIDKGSRHGVKVKDSVMTENGIVGRVIEVGPNYAKVATILDPSVSIGCMVSRTGDSGLVGGDNVLSQNKQCTMSLLARDTLATEGDEVITTGLGGVFPRGLPVGTVKEVLLEASGKSMYAIIDPYEDIESVKMVMVITSFDE